MLENIVIKGAREHNLKNVDVVIPRNKLVVFTGVSGSGKSSLAFGTIFAEGQRRFMESLTSYARQFLGQSQKPAVDYIEGLSPAIAIDQKTTNHNPRSTVGTVTEIYDYLRLLYARVGTPHCPVCGKRISRQTAEQICEQILQREGEQITIEAPVVRGEKGRFEKELNDWKRSGFVRVKIDGNLYMLDEPIALDKNIRHEISIVLDRITVSREEISRITEDVETALRTANGLVAVSAGEETQIFSDKYACIDCGISITELEPRTFSFNSPFGDCKKCSGLGFTQEIDPKLVIPNVNLSLAEGAINAPGWYIDSGKMAMMTFSSFAKAHGISLRTPIKDLPKDVVRKILYGTDERIRYEYKGATWENSFSGRYEGVIPNMMRRFNETTSDWSRNEIGKFMVEAKCSDCGGMRLSREALSVKVGGLNIFELTNLSIIKTLEFFENLKLKGEAELTAAEIIKEIKVRLKFLVDVGLHYLTLARSAESLSGGESQRIRLATQIGSGLVGVIYILDEPSIGLHQSDNEKLIATLKKLRDMGNTLIVVEHDEETMLAADHIVDIGKLAGVYGGTLVAQGTPQDIMANNESITGEYLSGAKKILVPKKRRPISDKFINVIGASENNLKNIDAKFPVGLLTAVTGVSGSGKSSLVNRILYPAASNALMRTSYDVGKYKEVKGTEHFDKVINIDQSPIGRTPRSNPATYTGVFTKIRDLFAETREAKARGYTSGRFSFNVRGGRCDDCDGDGIKKIEMHFLPDVFITCESCKGKRFNRETLEVKYKGKSIADVLDMTVDEATEFFKNIPQIYKHVKTIQDVGLGYIKLGQSATTLSGGEAQRVKLASELARAATGKTLYILDEPTTGLSTYDVEKLIAILNRLVDSGNTVVIIEHNLEVIKVADYIIDLGREGGDNGGEIVAEGTPEEVAKNGDSTTGRFIKGKLK
ncbi:MAG: excinuclease ABC subunit UvrA [Christensenellaceae bacterium]|jgi:excinuclease ABC subunit A|nr:excinuclease ABC subunit UvrA [Christensenellaceae bacterium]